MTRAGSQIVTPRAGQSFLRKIRIGQSGQRVRQPHRQNTESARWVIGVDRLMVQTAPTRGVEGRCWMYLPLKTGACLLPQMISCSPLISKNAKSSIRILKEKNLINLRLPAALVLATKVTVRRTNLYCAAIN